MDIDPSYEQKRDKDYPIPSLSGLLSLNKPKILFQAEQKTLFSPFTVIFIAYSTAFIRTKYKEDRN